MYKLLTTFNSQSHKEYSIGTVSMYSLISQDYFRSLSSGTLETKKIFLFSISSELESNLLRLSSYVRCQTGLHSTCVRQAKTTQVLLKCQLKKFQLVSHNVLNTLQNTVILIPHVKLNLVFQIILDDGD